MTAFPATACADQARREAAARRRHWPAKVASGAMQQAEAERDIAAWEAIAAILDGADAGMTRLAPLRAVVEITVTRRMTLAWEARDTDRAEAEETRLARLLAIRTHLDARIHAALGMKEAA